MPEIEEYDLVAVCFQECPRKFKMKRANEIETYLRQFGFTAVSSEFVDMWEMFLLVFVKTRIVF